MKKIIPIIIVIPFILGTIGYLFAEEKITDSLYDSIVLYWFSPTSDAYNIWIEIARWTAPLVTATAIFYAIQNIWNKLCWLIKSFSKDSVAIYSNTDTKIRFESDNHSVIYPGTTLIKRAKSHIIMFDSDEENIHFYENNKKKIKDKSVYISIKEIDYALMKDTNNLKNVYFFDIDGAISRNLWKQISIWNSGVYNLSQMITIWGTGHLGQDILNYGLLMNLYSLKQKITYNFIGDNNLYKIAHGNIETCNCDCINYFNINDDSLWEVIRQSNIVIISEGVSVDILQTMGIVCKNGQVYYYSPKEGCIDEYLKLSNIKPFGRNKDIYTDDNIRGNKLIKDAMQQNFEYVKKYGNGEYSDEESEWKKLDGFLKWSNISSSDFKFVLNELGKLGKDIEELSELEHIRWCRFHYLNYWTYGIPENGKNSDRIKKIHKCLCNYSNINETDKEKNREVVKEALKL